jgi:hypothetical protein
LASSVRISETRIDRTLEKTTLPFTAGKQETLKANESLILDRWMDESVDGSYTWRNMPLVLTTKLFNGKLHVDRQEEADHKRVIV